MEPEWNLITTEKEKETMNTYFEIESDYMPQKNFYSDPHNLKIRKLAVSVIAKHWADVEVDAFVPYLAMNYFDTFVSQSEEKPYSDIDQVPLIAIACLTIAAKMREFSDDFYLKDFDGEAIKEIELRIHNKLEGLTKPVTPFCFLDHFYPTFDKIGGFKRQCIHEIIVQAKGEDDFIEYKPSDIAFHSFMAATRVADLMIVLSVIKLPDGWNCCDEIFEKLFRLCKKKGIKIEPPGLKAVSSSWSTQGKSEEVKAAKTESIQQRQGMGKGKGKGKGKVKGKNLEILAPIVEEKRKLSASDDPLRYCPKKLMNFMLLWPTDDPFLVREPVEESLRASDEPVAPAVRWDSHCCSIG